MLFAVAGRAAAEVHPLLIHTLGCFGKQVTCSTMHHADRQLVIEAIRVILAVLAAIVLGAATVSYVKSLRAPPIEQPTTQRASAEQPQAERE